MTEIHPAAPHHLPGFLPGADGSDPLYTIVVVFLLLVLLGVGVVYFKLHSVPEHMGERQNSTQLQLISILSILALFTHNNAFWVLALLIAAIRIPDFLSPLKSIANSLTKLAGDKSESKPAEHSTKQDKDLDDDLPLGQPTKSNSLQSDVVVKGGE